MTKADYIVPNRLELETALKNTFEWLAEGDFAPDDIFTSSKAKFDLYFFPTYNYSGAYSAVANAGLWSMKQVPITRRDSNGNAYVDYHWQPTVIPHQQQTFGDFSINIYAGQDYEDKQLITFVEGTKWQEHQLQSMIGDAGQYDEMYFHSKQRLWDSVGFQRVREMATEKAKGEMPLPVFNIAVGNFDFSTLNCHGVFLPYFIFAYGYKDKPYHVLIDCNNPERIYGTYPIHIGRQILVTVLWVLLTALGILTTYLMVKYGVKSESFLMQILLLVGPGFLGFALGGTAYVLLIEYWKKRRRNFLAKFSSRFIKKK